MGLISAVSRFGVRNKRILAATLTVCLVSGLFAWQWYRHRQALDDEAADSLLADLANDSERMIRATKSLPLETELSTQSNYEEQYRRVSNEVQLTIERRKEFIERSLAIKRARVEKGLDASFSVHLYLQRTESFLEAFEDRLKLLEALIKHQSSDDTANEPVLVRLKIDPTAKTGRHPYSKVTLASSLSGARMDGPKEFDEHFEGEHLRLIGRVTRIEQYGLKCNIFLDGLKYKEARMEFEPEQIVKEGGIIITQSTNLCIEGICSSTGENSLLIIRCRVIEKYRNWSAGLDAFQWWQSELKAGRRPEASPQGKTKTR